MISSSSNQSPSLLSQCSNKYGMNHRECRPFVCSYPSLSGSELSDHPRNNWALSGDAKDCQILWSPFAPPRETKPAEQTYMPTTYDGVPIDYEMQSFYQPFVRCENDDDIANEAVRQRNIWNARGKVELPEIPAYKACSPSTLNITRKGDPVSRDGIVSTAQNLLNPDAESDLHGLRTFLVQGDTAVKSRNSQYCVSKNLQSRYNVTKQLSDLYQETTIDNDLFKRQRFTEYDPTRNVAWQTPHLFNNCTKAKISV